MMISIAFSCLVLFGFCPIVAIFLVLFHSIRLHFCHSVCSVGIGSFFAGIVLVFQGGTLLLM